MEKMEYQEFAHRYEKRMTMVDKSGIVIDSGSNLSAQFQAYIRMLDKFPIMSKESFEALSLLSSEDVDIGKVERIISKDPAMTVEVIKTSNRGLVNPTNVLRMALIRIGIIRTMSVIISHGTFSSLPDDIRTMIGTHYNLSAKYGFLLSKRLGIDSDIVQTASMLHDIGVGLFLHFLQRNGMPLVIPDLSIMEKQMFGFSHAEAGAAYLKISFFPKEVTELVRIHADPIFTLTRPAICVRLAELMAIRESPYKYGKMKESDINEAMSALGLKNEDIENIVEATNTEE